MKSDLANSQLKALLTLAGAFSDMRLSAGVRLGPYEIVEPVDRGGMGEVYRAFDRRLNRSVAIKIVTGAAGGDVRARFVREAQAVARLEHPHVCRVYDVGRDQDLDYLVMEYLDGETLASRLAEGRLPRDEAIAIGRQIADALAYTHERGLLHRDLKPGNVMLTAGGAKVLDFGLACPTSMATRTVAGTLHYLSPEQADGAAATPQSDIFALGAMLYEMLSGRRAFGRDTPSLTLAAILHQDPAPLREAGVHSPALQAIVAKCLAKNPGERWRSAAELAGALGELPERAGRQRRRAAAAAAVAAIALIGGWAVWAIDWRVSDGARTSVTTGAATRRSIAVLGFRNLSGQGDADWLSPALAEMLTTELTASNRLRAIAGENVARMKVELKLMDTDSYAADTLARIRNNLGTDLIVTGSYVMSGTAGARNVRLDVRVQDTRAGGRVASITDSGGEDALPHLISRVGGRLRADLGIDALSSAESANVRATLPSSSEAIRLYAQGLEKYRAFDLMGARDRLERAVAADPSNAIARSMLAAAWASLGYDARAREEARLAAKLAESLPREQRLPIEARARALAGDSTIAIENYQELWRLSPDSLDYGLALAHAQRSGGAAKDALATIATLRQLPRPWGDDPRIDVVAASANEAVGDFAGAHAAAMAGAQKAADRGAALLVADARRLDGLALFRLARYPEALAACADAQRIAREAGDGYLEGMATVIVGNVHYSERNHARAKESYQRALELFRSIGHRAAIAGTLNNIANIEHNQGRLDVAERMYDEVLSIARELDRKRDVWMAVTNLGLVMADRGNLTGAIERHEHAVAATREIGDKSGIVSALRALGGELRDYGDLPKAHRLLDEALRITREINQKSQTVAVLNSLSAVAAEQGDARAVAAHCEEARTLSREISKVREADTDIVCAGIAISAGQLDEAERMAQRALETYRSERMDRSLPLTYRTLTRAYLATGKIDEARRTFALVKADAPQSLTFRWANETLEARLHAAEAPEQAAAALQNVVAEATQHRYLRQAFEARLSLAEVQLQANQRAAARETLRRLRKEASARGFALIARNAAGMLADAR